MFMHRLFVNNARINYIHINAPEEFLKDILSNRHYKSVLVIFAALKMTFAYCAFAP